MIHPALVTCLWLLAAPPTSGQAPLSELELRDLVEENESKVALLKAIVKARCVDFDVTPQNAKALDYVPEAVLEDIVECRSRVVRMDPPADGRSLVRLAVDDRYKRPGECHLFIDLPRGTSFSKAPGLSTPHAIIPVSGGPAQGALLDLPPGQHSFTVYCDPASRANTTWKILEAGRKYELFMRRQVFAGSVKLLEFRSIAQ